MNAINLAPFYRNTIGFDRFATLLDSALASDQGVSSTYPSYNIEIINENEYAITLAVAGFTDNEIDISVEKDVLTVSGKKESEVEVNYLHRGISEQAFERKFNLADYVEVTDANLAHGLLTIQLFKEVPEAAKPKKIEISKDKKAIDHKSKSSDKKQLS